MRFLFKPVPCALVEVIIHVFVLLHGSLAASLGTIIYIIQTVYFEVRLDFLRFRAVAYNIKRHHGTAAVENNQKI